AIEAVSVHEATHYLLTLLVVPGEALRLQLFYDVSRLSSADVGRLLHHLSVLLESLIQTPQARLCDLSLLDGGERRQLLHDWNASAAPFDHDAAIHRGFEVQAEAAPTAVALTIGEAHWSYAELNRRANALAHALIAFGAGPEMRVGVCLKRDVN